MVRTAAFQAVNRGSIPRGAIKKVLPFGRAFFAPKKTAKEKAERTRVVVRLIADESFFTFS